MADPCFQGKTYGIWKLSDLGANTTNEFVALFLFGDVYKEHWKTTEGSVVALLNASILPAKEVSNWTHTFDCRLLIDQVQWSKFTLGSKAGVYKAKDMALRFRN